MHRPVSVPDLPIKICDEGPEDAQGIDQVRHCAFGGQEEADLLNALREHRISSISLVAALEDRIVGHILFTPVTIQGSLPKTQILGIGPRAVLPELQRRGIGPALVRVGLERCRQASAGPMIVVGYACFYPRFGFVPAQQYGLRFESEVPTEAFMALELRLGARMGHRGVVEFSPEFRKE